MRVCVLFCAEASFLYERPLTTPSLFFSSLISPWTLLYRPLFPTTQLPLHLLLFSLCVLSSLYTSFHSWVSLPHHQISLILRLYTRARWGERCAAPSHPKTGGCKRSFRRRRVSTFFSPFCGQATLLHIHFNRISKLIHLQV